MADIIQKKKYSDLPQTATLKDNDMVLVSDGITSRTITADNLKNEILKDVEVDTSDLATVDQLNTKVSTTTTVNAKPLSSNVILNGADLLATGYTKATTQSAIAFTDSLNVAIGKVEKKADDNITALAGKVSTTTTVNSKPLSSNVTLSLDDIADGTTRKLANIDADTIDGYHVDYKTYEEYKAMEVAGTLDPNTMYLVPELYSKELPDYDISMAGKILAIKGDGTGAEWIDAPTSGGSDLTTEQIANIDKVPAIETELSTALFVGENILGDITIENNYIGRLGNIEDVELPSIKTSLNDIIVELQNALNRITAIEETMQ